MPEQQYQPLSEEAAGVLSSDDDGQTLSKNQMQPMQTGVPTLGNTTENPSGALIQSSTEPTNLEIPNNEHQRELVTPDQNIEKSPAAGMTQTTQKNVAIQDRHIKSNDMIEVLERESDPMQSSAKPSSTSLIKNAEWQAQTQPANAIDSKITGVQSNMAVTEKTDLPAQLGQSTSQLNPASTMKT